MDAEAGPPRRLVGGVGGITPLVDAVVGEVRLEGVEVPGFVVPVDVPHRLRHPVGVGRGHRQAHSHRIITRREFVGSNHFLAGLVDHGRDHEVVPLPDDLDDARALGPVGGPHPVRAVHRAAVGELFAFEGEARAVRSIFVRREGPGVRIPSDHLDASDAFRVDPFTHHHVDARQGRGPVDHRLGQVTTAGSPVAGHPFPGRRRVGGGLLTEGGLHLRFELVRVEVLELLAHAVTVPLVRQVDHGFERFVGHAVDATPARPGVRPDLAVRVFAGLDEHRLHGDVAEALVMHLDEVVPLGESEAVRGGLGVGMEPDVLREERLGGSEVTLGVRLQKRRGLRGPFVVDGGRGILERRVGMSVPVVMAVAMIAIMGCRCGVAADERREGGGGEHCGEIAEPGHGSIPDSCRSGERDRVVSENTTG